MSERYHGALVRDAWVYTALFKKMKSDWRLDASTSYLRSESAPGLIHEYNPDARLIILIRDPVERALSHFRLLIRLGRYRWTLSEALDAELASEGPSMERFLLRPSLYVDAIDRYRAYFSRTQLQVVTYESLFARPTYMMGRMLEWLDLTADGLDFTPRFDNTSRPLNRSGSWMNWMGPSSVEPVIEPEALERLRWHIEHTEDYVGLVERDLREDSFLLE